MTMGLDNMDHSNSGGVGAKKGFYFRIMSLPYM